MPDNEDKDKDDAQVTPAEGEGTPGAPVAPEGWVSPQDFNAHQSKMGKRQADLEGRLTEAAQAIQGLAAEREQLRERLFELENADEDDATKASKKQERQLASKIASLEAEIGTLKLKAAEGERQASLEAFADQTGVPLEAIKGARTPTEMYSLGMKWLKEQGLPAKTANTRLVKAQERIASGAETFDKGEAAGGRNLLRTIETAEGTEWAELERRAMRGDLAHKK